jgi:hypothetical protein
MTFSLYEDKDTTVPLWSEVQNVEISKRGAYTVLLGSTTLEGIPAALFADKQTRWLGVRVENEVEEPRILLLSVPYAMKAADADTIGGRPASHFVTVENVSAYTQHALQQYLLENPEIANVASASQTKGSSTGSVQLRESTLQRGRDGGRLSVVLADTPGGDAGVAIAEAYVACPATGCVIDARGFTGEQTIRRDPFQGGTKPVTLLLGIATYTTSAAIALPSRSQLRGEGAATVLKAAASLGDSPVVRNASYYVTVESARDSGLLISNLTIDASQSSNNSSFFGHCIEFRSVVESTIERVWCIGPRNDGIYIGASFGNRTLPSTHILAAHNYISTAGRNGISVTAGTHITLTGNTITASRLFGIDLESTLSATIRNIVVTENFLDRNGALSQSIGIVASCESAICQDVLIQKNSIANQTGAGIGFRGVNGITITENMLRSVGSTGIGLMYGNVGQSTGVHIGSNTVHSAGGAGIFAVGNARGWRISGNEVQDSGEAGIRLGPLTSGMVVVGNSVAKARNHCIYAQGTVDSSFSANRVEECRGSGIILLAGSGVQSSGNNVTNNVARGNFGYGVVENPIDNPDYNHITDNILSLNVLGALQVKYAPHSVYSPNIVK